MPAQVLSSIENNFTKGLITDATGLNFPENAATDADNCVFTLLGNVTRRLGIDYEANYSSASFTRSSSAINTYKWNNAGGDGVSQIVVTQIGSTLYFYLSSSSTTTGPVSTRKLTSTVDFSGYRASGSTAVVAQSECQFADGNGYLFVFHPNCEPFYCIYAGGTITSNFITVQIRDFAGIPEIGVADNIRPSAINNYHRYNLINQGWISGSPWTATSTSSVVLGTGAKAFTVAAGLPITPGQAVTATGTYQPFPVDRPSVLYTVTMVGTVSAYAGTALTLSISAQSGTAGTYSSWSIIPTISSYIDSFSSSAGVYPSNADQWWSFKNNSGVFDPATTLANTTIGSGPAPKGSMILSAFYQQRGVASGVLGTNDVVTTIRPKTGTWFQGRIWYTGTDASYPGVVEAPFSSWTENIYFSQIVFNTTQFGRCYQQNDPSSELLFDLLPTDGGVITIQGCGSIYKLFPTQNGIIVFAANGIWFITGSHGIGFTANDYTITKLSNIQSISCTSFVNVKGLPYFWNEEGIYAVEPTQGGALSVNPITVGVLQTFYDTIPTSSKRYVRGDYHPIDYTIQWIYSDEESATVDARYNFKRALNFNTYNKAFYPYSFDDTGPYINGINYVTYPGGVNSPEVSFKYLSTTLTSGTSYLTTFAEEYQDSYLDFESAGTGIDYESYFVTGYRLHGQGQKKFQNGYIYVYSQNSVPTSYRIQGLWDYAISGNSGKYTSKQLINNYKPYAGYVIKRTRIRGQGLVLQIKIDAVTGAPFDIVGWATFEQMNQGV